MQNAISIWLDTDINTLDQRVKRNKNRPLLKKQKSEKKLLQLYSLRKNIYKLANHKIECNRQSKNDIINKIIKLYEK